MTDFGEKKTVLVLVDHDIAAIEKIGISDSVFGLFVFCDDRCNYGTCFYSTMRCLDLCLYCVALDVQLIEFL